MLGSVVKSRIADGPVMTAHCPKHSTRHVVCVKFHPFPAALGNQGPSQSPLPLLPGIHNENVKKEDGFGQTGETDPGPGCNLEGCAFWKEGRKEGHVCTANLQRPAPNPCCGHSHACTGHCCPTIIVHQALRFHQQNAHFFDGSSAMWGTSALMISNPNTNDAITCPKSEQQAASVLIPWSSSTKRRLIAATVPLSPSPGSCQQPVLPPVTAAAAALHAPWLTTSRLLGLPQPQRGGGTQPRQGTQL